jgi:hypothetical protein
MLKNLIHNINDNVFNSTVPYRLKKNFFEQLFEINQETVVKFQLIWSISFFSRRSVRLEGSGSLKNKS